MGLSTFIGGVHPYEGKELSADKPIQVIQPKGELVYPLSQHIGAPAKPLVAKGDKVLVGQKIAEAGGFISANVICSVSGTVKGIEPRLVANGAIVQSLSLRTITSTQQSKVLAKNAITQNFPRKRSGIS